MEELFGVVGAALLVEEIANRGKCFANLTEGSHCLSGILQSASKQAARASRVKIQWNYLMELNRVVEDIFHHL